MKTLITITGPSGAGKDTAARILSEISGIPVLVSYTTRPMREGEENGREHHFVPSCDTSHDQMLAYTKYGGYEYWTELSQISSNAIYVIDEAGLVELRTRFPDIRLFTIYITASKTVRHQRGVAYSRMTRDEKRMTLSINSYDFAIRNHFYLKTLRLNLGIVYEHIKSNILHNQ